MADEGFIVSQLAGIQNANDRKILEECFRHLVRTLRFGEPDHQTKLTNFSAYYQQSTTAGSTSEFSVLHGMGTAPHLAIPVLDVSQVGAQLVPLEVTRAADTKRVYLKSTSTNATIVLLLE